MASTTAMDNAKKKVQFVDLPQEIRDLIFLKTRETSWIDITSMFQNVQQPAISKVSRRIRHESLDVFYGKEKFILDLRGWKDASYPATWTPQKIFHEWILNIGDANAARLRSIAFYSHTVAVYLKINPESKPHVTFKFRLTHPSTRPDVGEDAPHGYSFDLAAQRAEARLKWVVDELLATRGGAPLQCVDFVMLCDTVESLQPVVCTRYNIGYKGAVLTADPAVPPNNTAHKEKCEECGYHRIVGRHD